MVQIEIDPKVFNKVYLPYLHDMARTQIFYGGSSSGKSVFLAQRCVYDILKGGRNYLIVRQVGKTIRGSVFNEIKKVISDWDLSGLFTVNKTDFVITCENGYQIVFVGLDDVEKVKSITPTKGVFSDLWIEEATEIERNSLKQLYKRQRGGDESTPKRLMMSFNPIMQSHFLYETYFKTLSWTDKQTEYKSDDLSILKTTYKDNRFLTSGDIADLENETDPYYFKVYSCGEWGVLGNVIFTNWRVEDLSSMSAQFTNRRNGLDFGFSSDPAALSRSHYDRVRKTIYIFAELYERGLTNDVLADEIKKTLCSKYMGKDKKGDTVYINKLNYLANEEEFRQTYNNPQPFDYDDIVICDSAEPKSIVELQRYGIDAQPAEKGKDSVLFGIQWLQQQTIIIDASCINTRNEFMSYKWKEDGDGNAMRQPVDKMNHIIDATRYAYEQDNEFMSTWEDVESLGKTEQFVSRWR